MPTTAGVPPQIAAQLEPGERLYWWDRPKTGLVFRTEDFALIPVSLVWSSGALKVFSVAQTQDTNPIFFVVPILFVASAIYLTVGRFVHDIWRRSRLFYGITDQRVLIVSPSGTDSIRLQGIWQTNVKKFRGGFGSVSLDSEPAFLDIHKKNKFRSWSGAPTVPTLEYIGEPDRVLQEIQRLQEKAEDED